MEPFSFTYNGEKFSGALESMSMDFETDGCLRLNVCIVVGDALASHVVRAITGKPAPVKPGRKILLPVQSDAEIQP